MKIRLPYVLLFVAIFFASKSEAQLTGTITVPNATYTNLATVVTALNTQGVGAGGVTINLTASNPQTAPAGGYLLGSAVLNASTGATKKIVINGNGNTITSFPGVSTTIDGIFMIQGTDYLTINGLNLAESAANTTATTAMEWGYALLNLNSAAPFDGCQFDTIRNCTITLNRTIATPSSAIYSGHHLYNNTTVLNIAAAEGLHSNNGYYSNTFTNVTRGIYLNGPSLSTVPTLYDQNNDVGGYSAATGNTMNNCMGTNYTNIGGLTCTYQQNANLSNNYISNTANGGAPAIGGIWGIYAYGPGADFTVNKNTIILGESSINITYFVYGIYSNALTTNITAQNNSITLNEIVGATASVPCYGIFHPNGNNSTLTGDTIIQNQGMSGSTYGIYTTATGTLNLNSNTITQTSTNATNNQYYSIVSAGIAAVENMQNNNFKNTNIQTNGTSGFGMMIYTVNATGVKNITGNFITGSYTHNSSSTPPTYGVYNPNTAAPGAGTANISNNNFSNISRTGAGSGAVYGVYYAPTVATPQNYSINNNIFNNITNANTAPAYGIYFSSGTTDSVYANTISNITAPGGVYGIYDAGTSTVTAIIGKNKIYSLNGTTAAGIAYGITVAAGTTTKIFNNIIGDLLAPTATGTIEAIRGINLISAAATSTFSVYYNTIYLNATSTGANFSTTGIYHSTNATATTAALDLRNNIIVNKSTATGTGITAAYRRSSTALTNFTSTSNNNLFYAGTPGANQLIMYDGTNSYQTLTTYKTAVTPRDAVSITENPNFLSTTGSAVNYLHFGATSSSTAESAGANISGFTTDFDGDIRAGNAGYTGGGTAPDIGADEFETCNPITITTQPVNTTICLGANTSLFVTATNGNLYQWQVNTGAGFNNVANGGVYSGATTATLNITNPPVGMSGYTFRCFIRFSLGCTADTTNIITLTINPVPSSAANITPSTPSTACDSLLLTANSGINLSYQWRQNNINIPGATGLTYMVTTSANYSVTVTNTSNCSQTSAPVVITINPSPIAVVTYSSPISFCFGGAVVLNSYTSTGLHYKWLINGVPSATDTLSTIIVHETGNYSVQISNGFGCTGVSQAVHVQVNALPTPAITRTGNTLSTGNYVLYQWYFNHQPVAGATNQTFQTNQDGGYNVAVTDNNGCQGLSPVMFINSTGIDNTGTNDGIKLYPNPAYNKIYIEAPVRITATIRDMQGRTNIVAIDAKEIDISGLAVGIYVVAISNEDGQLIKNIKLIKTK